MAEKKLEITDEQIERAFLGCKFGPKGETAKGRRELVVQATFKNMAKYWNGHTVHCILEELGLVDCETGNTTIPARRWCYHECKTKEA